MRKLAADQLLAEHEPALRNFLGARCRDAEMTAELLQEVAVRLVAAAPRVSLNGNARGYLFRIAANVWHDYLRRELVRREHGRVALEFVLPARRRNSIVWATLTLAAAAVLAGVMVTKSGSSRAAVERWAPTTTWSTTAGYVAAGAGGKAMVEIDAQL